MAKTQESIATALASAKSISQVELTPTENRRTHEKSKWSMSFKSKEGEDAFATLQRIFGLSETTRNLFNAAASGDGNEKERILTLHSSALLAFLCFNDVANHPITIDGTLYDEVMFEVKNDVIDASLGKPSNIDVLLMGENRKKLLFLESKFTEYLTGGKVELSTERYEKFYDILFKKCTFTFSSDLVDVRNKPDKTHKEPYIVEKIRLSTGKKTTDYLHGIKQAFSHLLGIATGPASEQAKGNEAYDQSLLDNASEIKFASIVFNCDNEKFEKYNVLYKSVFENSNAIKEAITEVLNKRELNLTIVPQLLQYQEVFQHNYLSDKVREFYQTVNDSEIGFLTVK
ncbi:MAG: hypothetical protein ACI4AM_04915 [Muribaculaceae bacterium]